MTASPAATAFKILTADQWARWQRDDLFLGAPVDHADGFIHLSARDQVAETAARHFAGQQGLIVAEIALDTLGDTVKWEPSRGGALFPHIYGSIGLDAVVHAGPLDGMTF